MIGGGWEVEQGADEARSGKQAAIDETASWKGKEDMFEAVKDAERRRGVEIDLEGA